MRSAADSSRAARRLPYAAAALAALSYVLLSAAGAGPGFPLDDGWIHLTYARSLAESGRLAFAPGIVSAGSTSPLWTLLLAVGHFLPLSPLLWSFLLGALSLLALVWAIMSVWRALWPAQAERDWVGGGAAALSWPLVWAAGSGMETLLFAALGLFLLALFLNTESVAWGAGGATHGLLAGLLVLTRPEGAILAALLAAALLLQRDWRRSALFCAAMALPLAPYFAFNLSVSGILWPNTFYAKQMEYAALLAQPLPARFARLLYFSLGGPESGWRGLSGAHLVLAPGLLLAGWRALRSDWERRRLWRTIPLWWAGGHLLAYAIRLPVTYQHGRYLWAALPVWILFGVAGWRVILGALRRRGRGGQRLAQAAALSFAVLLLFFLFLGAAVYAEDVAFVENEMVDVALWLRDNTPSWTLVAAHDIGALGYFAQRPLLDLAGLVSPEVIPLLQDEEALAAYVRTSGATYLVTAPGWPYPTLTAAADAQLLYDTGYAWTRQQGLNNMAVYALESTR